MKFSDFLKNGPLRKQKFQSRQEAGKILAENLKTLNLGDNLIVCAIPRGGVIVGAQIAKELKAKLTVLPIKKITTPVNPELAVGAVGPVSSPILDKPLISTLQISRSVLLAEIEKAKDEVKRRMAEYGVKKQNFFGKIVILTDDGVATGSTINLAARLIKATKPEKLILAVPLVPAGKISQLKKKFDQVVVLLTPADFTAVGQFYYDFPQVTDEEVKRILAEANR